MFNQIFNRPRAAFDACSLRWRRPRCLVSFAEIVISEIQRNRSLKVFKFFTESVRKTGQTAAVHTQRVILPFNMAFVMRLASGNTLNDGALRAHDFGRRIPIGRVFVEVGHTVGFYELAMILFAPKNFFNRRTVP